MSATLPLPSPQRLLAFLTVLALALALLVTGAATASPAGATSTEASVTSKVNRARAVRGVHTLRVRSDLIAVARRQARRMADRNTLYHNPRLSSEVRNYRWAGENVGYGPSVVAVHNAFMASPGHKQNLLDRSYTEIGVGAVWRNGRVWIAQVFRKPLRSTAAPKARGSRGKLREGSSGPRVARVQRRLGVRPTGYFGPVTERKVKAFQRARGMKPTGTVGRPTWRRLF